MFIFFKQFSKSEQKLNRILCYFLSFVSSVPSLLWQLWTSHATFVNLARSLSSTLRAAETQFCASPEVRLGFQPWVGFLWIPGLRPDLVDEIHLGHLKALQKVTEASVLYFIYACTYTCAHCEQITMCQEPYCPLVPIWGRRERKKGKWRKSCFGSRLWPRNVKLLFYTVCSE